MGGSYDNDGMYTGTPSMDPMDMYITYPNGTVAMNETYVDAMPMTDGSCMTHTDCDDTQYCDVGSNCYACSELPYYDDSIDGMTPAQCDDEIAMAAEEVAMEGPDYYYSEFGGRFPSTMGGSYSD